MCKGIWKRIWKRKKARTLNIKITRLFENLIIVGNESICDDKVKEALKKELRDVIGNLVNDFDATM
jgi:hypothetical protein